MASAGTGLLRGFWRVLCGPFVMGAKLEKGAFSFGGCEEEPTIKEETAVKQGQKGSLWLGGISSRQEVGGRRHRLTRNR